MLVRRTLGLVALVGWMSGCVPMQPGYQPNPNPSFQVDDSSIKDVWGRGQSWIALHSKLKIQTATDYLIETYGTQASNYDVDTFAYRVVRSPLGSGRSQIDISCVAANMFYGSAAAVHANELADYMRAGAAPVAAPVAATTAPIAPISEPTAPLLVSVRDQNGSPVPDAEIRYGWKSDADVQQGAPAQLSKTAHANQSGQVELAVPPGRLVEARAVRGDTASDIRSGYANPGGTPSPIELVLPARKPTAGRKIQQPPKAQ